MTDQTPSIALALIETGALNDSVKQAAISAILDERSDAPQDWTKPEDRASVASAASPDDVGTLSEGELYAYAKATAARDDGRIDYDAAHRAAVERYKSVQARLDAHTFDRQTGAKVHAVTGDQRKALELQARQAGQEVVLSAFTAQAVGQARTERAERKKAQEAEEAALFAIAGTDPARRAALEEALLRVEMEDVARRIAELRKRR